MRLCVTVHPGASRRKIEKRADTEYHIWVHERPHDGAANRAVIDALSQQLHIPRRAFTILRGETSRTKIIGVIPTTE